MLENIHTHTKLCNAKALKAHESKGARAADLGLPAPSEPASSRTLASTNSGESRLPGSRSGQIPKSVHLRMISCTVSVAPPVDSQANGTKCSPSFLQSSRDF